MRINRGNGEARTSTSSFLSNPEPEVVILEVEQTGSGNGARSWDSSWMGCEQRPIPTACTKLP